ncbi:MAG: CBS domain-containing protein [Planctomycetota bacterium]|jgi:signal transduction histidine kinase
MPEVARIERLVKRLGTVLIIDVSESVAAAARRMKNNGIGCLIVVDVNEVVGILTERDIVDQVVACSVDPAVVEVRSIMSEHIVACQMETPISDAQHIMATKNIRHLPIVEKGVPIGMVSSRDILAYQLHETRTRLAHASKQARVAQEAKSELLSNVSYEIRTPMNSILGMTELAMDTHLTHEQRDCLGVVKNSAESLLGMINDLLDFSNISAGKVQLRSVEFELRDQVSRIIRTLGHRAEAKQLDLTCKILPDVPERVMGDPGRVCQVLVNLVANAIKFTDSGHVAVQVEAKEWGEDTALLQFSVADTGTGIPEEKQKVIFEGFRHAEESYTRMHEGLGLGLAISAQVIRQMGGNIWIESEVGKGSTFYFTVQLQPQKQPGGWEYRNKARQTTNG